MAEKTSLPKRSEVATLGGGCFWCTDAVFSMLEGVQQVEPGYAGGSVPNPTYEQVSTGTTGHAEVVQLTFNPDVISFRQILEVFFAVHDPTTLNKQGSDIGTQYRSIILHHNDQQKAIAENFIAELEKEKPWNAPIMTEVQPFRAFYKAEDYHKNYFMKHPEQQYCQLIIAPKIEKLRKTFIQKLKVS
jgi:peptide-methionine (S)-S-oxide reductase